MTEPKYRIPPVGGVPSGEPLGQPAPKRRPLLGVLLLLTPFLALMAVAGVGGYYEWSKPDPRLCRACLELRELEGRTDEDARLRRPELEAIRAKQERGRRAFDAARLEPGVSVVTCPGCQKAGYGRP